MEELDVIEQIISRNAYVVGAYGFAAMILFVAMVNSINRVKVFKHKVHPKIEPIKFHYP